MLLTTNELTYYSRQVSLEKIGVEGQQKLKNARVLCIGMGGLGCPVALYLTAAGVGTLGMVDPDYVEISNLHRQILYTKDDIGLLKTEVAYQKLSRLNPHIKFISYPTKLTTENIFEIINAYDIVADCTDNFATRYLINDACFYAKKPVIYAAISQFEGQCSVFNANNGPCYRCLFDLPPDSHLIPNCVEAGVLGVLPGLLGNLQAIEIIKWITGIGASLIGKLLTIDVLSMTFKTLVIPKHPECRLCQHQESFESLQTCEKNNFNHDITSITPTTLKALREKNQIFLLDVRERHEYETSNMGGYLIPLPELPNRLDELNPHQNIVIHCRKGPRSQQAALILKQAGFTQVSYLVGGITAWEAMDNF